MFVDTDNLTNYLFKVNNITTKQTTNQMKNKIITALTVGMSACSLQAFTIASSSGTTSDGIGFTVTGDTDFTTNVGAIRTADNNGGSITFTFTDHVDLTITSLASGGPIVLDGNGANNSFAADQGTWSFTAGTVGNAGAIITGSTLTVDGRATGGTGNSNQIAAADDWGSFEVVGAKSVVWTYNDDTNFEAFTFDAVASAVPEPSSTALLGLGGLALLARRR